MVDFSKITYNWDAINDYPNDDLTITITTKVKEITDAVYEMEENAFRSVVVDRMRELGYTVFSPEDRLGELREGRRPLVVSPAGGVVALVFEPEGLTFDLSYRQAAELAENLSFRGEGL